MKLYRTIGEGELFKILNNSKIEGQYNCSSEKQNDVSCDNVVCFYLDENFKWKDSRHKFEIVINVNDFQKGEGVYYVSDSVIKTGIWSGRRGKQTLKVKEAYIKEYNASMVCEIRLCDHFNNSYANYLKEYVEGRFPHIKFTR